MRVHARRLSRAKEGAAPKRFCAAMSLCFAQKRFLTLASRVLSRMESMESLGQGEKRRRGLGVRNRPSVQVQINASG
jgi:hypothetical protein